MVSTVIVWLTISVSFFRFCSDSSDLPHRLLMAISLTTAALILICLIYPYLPILTDVFVLISFVATTQYLLDNCRPKPPKRCPAKQNHWLATTVGLYAALIIIVLGRASELLPLAAWDALDYWGINAKLILISDDVKFWSSDQKHSMLASHLLANSAIDSATIPPMFKVSPYLFLALSILTTIISLFLRAGFNSVPALFAGIVFALCPLLENHVLLIGYAELPLLSCALLMSALLYEKQKGAAEWGVIGVLSSLILLTKNYGVIVVCFVLVSYLMPTLIRYYKAVILVLLLLSACIVSVIVIRHGLDIGDGPLRVVIDPYKNSYIILNKRIALSRDIGNLSIFLYNGFSALFMHSSFSFSPFFIIFCLGPFLLSQARRANKSFISWATFVSLTLFIFPLIISLTDYRAWIVDHTALPRYLLVVLLSCLPIGLDGFATALRMQNQRERFG